MTRRRPVAVLALFFASGAAGLVYEVVWARLLALTFSITVYAVTTVLCAYMAGLALGAAVGGRAADRLPHPLRTYGVVEIAIGVAGLATTFVLFRLGPAYVWLWDHAGGAGPVFGVGRFALAFLVMLVPCTLMGATLPLLGRAMIVSRETTGRGAGALYALNTLGAVSGCVLSGFVLVPTVGLRAATAVAAVLNVAVGIGAVLLARREPAAVPAPMPVAAGEVTPPAARGAVALACFALAVSGFTALGYEVLWTRALEQFVHNSTYAYSAMLATFLLGLGLGSGVAALVADRLRHPLRLLAAVEVAIGASVLVALLIYMRFVDLIPALAARAGGLGSWGRVIALIFGEAGATLLVTTLLFGATFPLAARLVVDRLDTIGTRLGAAYTANTVGSIAGAVLVGFVILPALGIRGAFVALLLVNLGLGALLALAGGGGAARAGIVGGAVAVAVGSLLLLPHGLFESTFARRFGKLLFYREEVTDTIMVTEDARGERMIRYGDGRGTAGTVTEPEDRMYAHIPLLLHHDPRRILNICFGVGNSLAGVVTHPIERVDAVELSPGVVDAAPYFRRTNDDVLADPRVRLITGDGRNFLLTADQRYDVIRLDPPELHTAGVVNLYTREFYELARDHLAPGGIFSIWVNIVMTPEEDLRWVVRTLRAVFPHVSIWHGPYRYSWVINGSLTPHDPDLARVAAAYADPRIGTDLRSVRVPDPYVFLTHFVMGGDDVAAFAGAAGVVTDDRTRLDFTVPRSFDSFFGIANANTNGWLIQLMQPGARGDVGTRMFFTKIAQIMRWKKPVLPVLRNPEALGLSVDEVAARLATAPAPTALAPAVEPEARAH
jgi:spermidine synthase